MHTYSQNDGGCRTDKLQRASDCKSFTVRDQMNQRFKSISKYMGCSHIPRSFRLGEEMRPQDATGLADGHVQGRARGLLRLRAQVVSDYI